MNPYHTDPNNIGQVFTHYDKNGIPQFNKRIVVTAANRFKCGTIVLGIRHWCPLMSATVNALGIDDRVGHEQGFVDQYGHFLSREEALEVVLKNNQVLRMPPFDDKKLYSENLH